MLLLALAAPLALPPDMLGSAAASSAQIAMFQPGAQRLEADPAGTLDELQALGVTSSG